MVPVNANPANMLALLLTPNGQLTPGVKSGVRQYLQTSRDSCRDAVEFGSCMSIQARKVIGISWLAGGILTTLGALLGAFENPLTVSATLLSACIIVGVITAIVGAVLLHQALAQEQQVASLCVAHNFVDNALDTIVISPQAVQLISQGITAVMNRVAPAGGPAAPPAPPPAAGVAQAALIGAVRAGARAGVANAMRGVAVGWRPPMPPIAAAAVRAVAAARAAPAPAAGGAAVPAPAPAARAIVVPQSIMSKVNASTPAAASTAAPPATPSTTPSASQQQGGTSGSHTFNAPSGGSYGDYVSPFSDEGQP